MSAAVIPFSGRWHGDAEPKPYEGREQCSALRDARLIRGAKLDNDDWTARLLLALLQTLSGKQLQLLEFYLLDERNLDNVRTLQALALVRLCTGDIDHRARVGAALDTLVNGRCK